MADFLSQYKAALAKNHTGAVAAGSAPVDLTSSVPSPTNAAKPGGQQDFLSWVSDILMRPLSVVTNPLNTGLSEIEKAQDPSKPYDYVGGLTNIATAPFRGLFSTNPEDHPTTSKIIENVDKVTGRKDPAELKGLLGFIGDVGLDPTTYIPGVDIAKLGAKFGIGAGKAAGDLEKAIVGGSALPGEKVAQAGVQDLPARIPEPTPAPTLAPDAAGALQSAMQPPVPKAEFNRVVNAQAALPSSIVKMSEKFPQAQKFLKELSAQPKVLRTLTVDHTKPLPAGQWLQEVAKARPDAKITPNFRLGELIDDPGLAQLPENKKALDALYRGYNESFLKAAERGKYLHPSGKIGAAPKPVPPAAVQSATERFAKMMTTEEGAARLDRALGSGVASVLRRTRTPENFARKVDEISQVLDRTEMLDKVTDPTQLTPGQAALVRHITAVPGHRSLDVPWLNNLRTEGGLTRPSDVGMASQLAEKAKTGDPASLAAFEDMKKPALTPTEQEVVDTLPQAMRNTIFERLPEGEGWKGYLNQEDQLYVNRALQDNAIKQIGERAANKEFQTTKAPEAFNRARALRDEVMNRLQVHDQLMAKLGVPLYIGVNHDLVPMSMRQIIERMNATNENAALMAFFNHATLVPETNVADAVNLALKGSGEDELVAALLNNTSRNGKHFPNQLVDNKGKLYFGHFRPVGARGNLHEPKFPFHSGPEDLRPTAVSNPKGTGYYAKYTPEQVARTVARSILDSKGELSDIAARNQLDYANRLSVETGDLAKTERTKLQELLSGDNASAALSALAHIHQDVADLGTAAKATQDSVNLASTIVEGTVEPDLTIAGSAAQKLANLNLSHVADWMDHAHFQSASQVARQADAAYGRNAEELFKLQQADLAAQGLIDAEPEVKMFDLTDSTYRDIASNTHRRLDPLGKALAIRSGNPHVWDALSGFLVASSRRMEKFTNDLADFARRNPGTMGDKTLIDQGFHNWQRGIHDPKTEKVVADIENIFGQNWRGKAALLTNPFFGREVSVDAIERELSGVLDPNKITGMDQFFDIEKALNTAATKRIPVAQAAMEQIHDWNITDSLDFMHKLYVAGERVNTNAAVMSHFVRYFSARGVATLDPAIAKAQKFVELSASGRSKYFSYLPPRTFVHPALAEELKVFDEFARMSRTLDSPFGKWFAREIDPLFRAWKRAVTVLRPGHHPRNLIGDSSMTFVAEGAKGFRRSMRNAVKALMLGRGYNNVDLSAMLEGLGVRELPRGGDIIAKLKDGPVSLQEAYEAMNRGGLFPSYRRVEGLFAPEAKNKFANTVEKLTAGTGRPQRIVGSISEARDHFSRAQHFMQILAKAEKKMPAGIRTRQQLFDYATQRVRKFHPDGSNLTPFEQKYLSRVIPFYTWFRGALPVVIESMLAHPGRTIAFQKAGYNMAVASGLNPDSISNPFPIGGVYPSFLTDQIQGPQFQLDGKQVGVSPGIAYWDIMNTISSPVQGLTGMVNPLIRVPAELLSGSRWGTQSPIKNVPEYLDQQIPGAGYVQNVTGYSPIGTIADILGGKAPAQATAFTKGNKTSFDQGLALFNYLSGLGGTNYSRADYQKIGQLEKVGK